MIARILRCRLASLLFFLFFATSVLAQVKFTTITSSKEIGRSDYVQVEFVVENAKQIEHLTPPSFPDFHIVEGPMQSSGMSVVNGNMSQYKGVSFILQPVKTGKFSIQGATAEVDGKLMHSNAVWVEVTTNSTGSTGSMSPVVQPSIMPRDPAMEDKEYVLRPGENIIEKTRKNLFVKVQVDRNSCYVGEPIVVAYKLYSRLHSESRVTKQPSLNGFSVYDMMDPNSDAASVENVHGKPFTVHTIRKAQLIPLQAGPVELSQVEVDNTVHFLKLEKHPRGTSILQSLIDQLSEGETGDDVQQHITLTSKPLTITVKPLPETNKPADYNGAVGHFSMDASMQNKNIAAQDAATLTVTIHGSGNLPVVDAPQVQWPSGVNVYNTTAKEDIDKTVEPMKGSKTFAYVFTPKTSGNYTIPAVQFSYFDPVSSSYKRLQGQPIEFNVSAAKKQSPSLFKNILASNSTSTIVRDLKDFFVLHAEWIFAALILFCVATFLWRHNVRSLKKENLLRAEALAQEQKKREITVPVSAGAEAVDPLLRAKRMLENADHRKFYAELNRALWEVMSQKFNLPASELNKFNISVRLKAKGWDEENIYKLQDILSTCEINLYTPDHSVNDRENTLHSA
ncbi:MAG TPA: BatD family protein, partial [Puia sp.]|nr:BatD family protein [Puia sp.]